jgi:transcriptional regulator with XRE-family HTH domain
MDPNKPKHSAEQGEAKEDELIDKLNISFGFLDRPVGHPKVTDEPNNMSKKHQLNEQLKLLLEDRKLSLRQLSKLSKVPISTLSGYLKADRAQLDPTHLLAIAKALDVTVDYLLTGKGRKVRIENVPTKKLFSRWVKLTIEEIDGGKDETE